METYSIADGWGSAPDSPEVQTWTGEREDGWERVWSLDEVRLTPAVEIEIWRYASRAYVVASGQIDHICMVECPSMPDALRCAGELTALTNTAALTELAGYLEELVSLAKAVLVDHGIPLPR